MAPAETLDDAGHVWRRRVNFVKGDTYETNNI
jgi:hypothetical protein